jgi:DeoR/GlpR family transcriptional regulator of sugar metabolism
VNARQLAPERLDRLREIVRDRRVVRVDVIGRHLRVSPATVRRDLLALEKSGEVQRVHGGVVSMGQPAEEPLFDDKASLAPDEKRRIAQAALAFVRTDDTIYLDGGSTILELARLLRDRARLTVVTNSLRAAQELAGGGPRLILIGGELRRLSQTLIGPLTRHLVGELHVDRAFMGTIGLSLREGMTTTDSGEAYTKSLVMERAREVILLADGSKIGKVSFARAGHWDHVRVLITDRDADPAFTKAMARRGIRVVRA